MNRIIKGQGVKGPESAAIIAQVLK